MSWMPVFAPQSPQAEAIAALFMNFLILAAVIFIIVSGLVIYSLVRYRARQHSGEPAKNFGSRRLEITWTVIPLMVVLALFIVTVRTMAFVDAPQEPVQPPDLIVTGHQWWWEARYPNGAVTADEIHIPAGTRALVRIESADVIHDFWLPELARKMDAVPGRPAYIWLEANAPRTYEGACSEFCGMQHAGMRFVVVAQPAPAFSEWLRHQRETSPEPSGTIAIQGARLFRDQKCGDCHTISSGEPSTGKGPTLSHIAARGLLGGRLANTRENLTLWITSPQSIKPGNKMPDQHIAAQDVLALVEYLETLQ